MKTTAKICDAHMMNHAFIITCHTDPIVLSRTIKILSSINHYFFIHIDKKYKQLHKYKCLENSSNVSILKDRIKVNWGGANQIKATLKLLQYAYSHKVHFEYYHFISGACFPCVSKTAFDEHFKQHNGISYLSYDAMQNYTVCKNRMELYHFNDLFDVRGKGQLLFLKGYFEKIANSIFRHRSQYNWKKGANWFSFHANVVLYILNYLESNPRYLRRFSFSMCADEIFFQTLLFDKTKDLNINTTTNLRYIDWYPRKKVSSLPAVLDMNDYNDIVGSGALLCRKVMPGQSDALMDMLEKRSNDKG